MSRGVKWRLEWAFFLGDNGRRQYNRLCKGCVHPCKQSFRAVVLDCPHFQSQRVQRPPYIRTCVQNRAAVR